MKINKLHTNYRCLYSLDRLTLNVIITLRMLSESSNYCLNGHNYSFETSSFFTHLLVNNLHPRLLSTQSCQVVVTDSTHLASLMATIAIG